MRILVDLNVMLDFLARREPFFEDSASVLDAVLYGQADGVLPAHGFTTLYYLLSKSRGNEEAIQAVGWLLAHFEVATCGRSTLVRAQELGLTDYEDAVVAAHAEEADCNRIVTRNAPDFAGTRSEPFGVLGRIGGPAVMKYAVVYERGERNWSAYVPDLPGCIATGHTREETERLVGEAIAFHIEGPALEGEPVPEPTTKVGCVTVLP